MELAIKLKNEVKVLPIIVVGGEDHNVLWRNWSEKLRQLESYIKCQKLCKKKKKRKGLFKKMKTKYLYLQWLQGLNTCK